jgi:hypothetical protein
MRQRLVGAFLSQSCDQFILKPHFGQSHLNAKWPNFGAMPLFASRALGAFQSESCDQFKLKSHFGQLPLNAKRPKVGANPLFLSTVRSTFCANLSGLSVLEHLFPSRSSATSSNYNVILLRTLIYLVCKR